MLLIPVVAFVHGVSATSSFLVLICMVIIQIHQRPFTYRISFRLTMFYTFFVFNRHLLKFIRIVINAKESNDKNTFEITLQEDYMKSLTFWLTVFAENLLLITVLYTLAIVVNLQLVLLHNVRSVLKYQLAYIITPIAVAHVVFIVCVIRGASDAEYWNGHTFITMAIFLAVLIYTSILSIIIVKKLYSIMWRFSATIPKTNQSETSTLDFPSFDDLPARTSSKSSSLCLTNRTIQYAVARILLYPLALALVGFPVFVIRLVNLFAPDAWDLDIVEYFMMLQGTVNAVAFLFDPTLLAAIKSFNSYLLINHSNHLCSDGVGERLEIKVESRSCMDRMKQLAIACYIDWFILRKLTRTTDSDTDNTMKTLVADDSTKPKVGNWDPVRTTYSMDSLHIEEMSNQVDFTTEVNAALEQIQVGIANFERSKSELSLL
ncbi:hypothetical protein K7432_005835 [Basidiobolus ranarum]|uniref:G protein-coupled receptor n=1 Tax=Basidiobolus ranarum TaxID=34480 RepID=A0ABR2W2P2_9FUNG